MAAVLKSLSVGPWGAEPIPECTAEVAAMADVVFRAVMSGDVASSSSIEALFLLARECPDVDPDVKVDAIHTAGEMLAARARRLVEVAADPACDGSGAPSCGICGSLTARQSDCAGRLYGASLTGRVDLGVSEAAWMYLAKGPDAVPGLTWDDFLPARTAAIRMLQARARVTPKSVIAAAEAALAIAEDTAKPSGSCDAAPAVFTSIASIRDALRTGLKPLHAAEQTSAA